MVASSVARSVVLPVASRVAASSGGVSYDSDALAYFSAVEGAGGSFDLTSINATYTEAYVKQAHSDLFAGLKADSVWSKITELYLLAGKTFGGLTVKAKGTGALTNNGPFVTGDWVAAGSGAGLKGNGSTKWLDTELLDSSLIADDKSFGVYTVEPSSTVSFAMGVLAIEQWSIIFIDLTTMGFRIPISTSDLYPAITTPNGFSIASRRGVNDTEVYKNGSSLSTDTDTSAATNSSDSWALFRIPESTFTDARLAAAYVGTGLTDTEAANLSTRVNYFMWKLGSEVYLDQAIIDAMNLDADVDAYATNVLAAGGNW